MYLIAGLGNPGDEYIDTRHNIGFAVVDKFAKKNNIKLNKAKFNSLYGEGRISGKKVMVVKPTTFMNRSGIAISEISNFYKIPHENIIVIADDIDIPFSSIRIRRNGSAGSHNGLKSIVESLKGQDFPRIKIGIGRNDPRQDLASFVLGKFNKEEKIYMDETVDIAVDAIEEILSGDINTSMNKFNNKITKAQA